MNWFPWLGHFEVTKKGIRFHGAWAEHAAASQAGASAPERVPSIGIALSDQIISEGEVSADVTFVEVERLTGCDIMIGVDIETTSFLQAGIPGFEDALFAIREWRSSTQQEGKQSPGWNTFSGGGDRQNLVAGRRYGLKVTVSGSRVDLAIDGVVVATATVPSNPKLKPQLGFWCRSHDEVVIENIAVTSSRPRAFVVMQFAAPYDEVYSEVIRSVCESFGFEAVRADELYGPGLIITDVVDQIQRARLVIADITPTNPNVYFEVGYALALRKPIILLAKKNTDLPFDVSGFRVLFYEDSIAGKAKMEEGLERHLRAIKEG